MVAKLDDIDRAILDALQADGRMSNLRLAESVVSFGDANTVIFDTEAILTKHGLDGFPTTAPFCLSSAQAQVLRNEFIRYIEPIHGALADCDGLLDGAGDRLVITVDNDILCI